MRPTLLNPLFAPVTSLAGVGPRQDKLFRYLLGRDETPRLVDLLLHLPASVIDRRARPKIREAVQGTMVTLEVTVDRHRPPPPRNSRAPYLVYASDETGDVVLTFFRAKPGYVEKLLPVGAKRYVSGTGQMFSTAHDLSLLLAACLDDGSIDPRLWDGLQMTQREVFRVGPQAGQAMAWETIGTDGPTIVGYPSDGAFAPFAVRRATGEMTQKGSSTPHVSLIGSVTPSQSSPRRDIRKAPGAALSIKRPLSNRPVGK